MHIWAITAEAGIASDMPDTRPKRASWTAVALQAAYYDTVFSYFSRRVKPREEAEDLTAETFLAAFQNLKKVQEPKLFLFGIARRKLADSLRQKAPARAGGRGDDNDRNRSRGRESRAGRLATRGDLRLARRPGRSSLASTPQNLSVREVADVMSRSEMSVKALLQRARETLRNNSQLRAFMEASNE